MSLPVEGIIGDWGERISNKETFMYVLDEYWETVSRFWKSEKTIRDYLSDYEAYILPEINNKPLADCTREDFDMVIAAVPEKKRREEKVCNARTIAHMRRLIKLVLEAAEKENICPDLLWGTEYALEDTDENNLNRDEFVKLRKSLTIQEELQISELLLSEAKQQPENFGLALMFCLGLRNNEACGADFGDIHPLECDPSIHTLWVYKSTEKGTNVQRFSGKTSNVSRIIPLPEKLVCLLTQRRALLEDSFRSKQTADGSASQPEMEERIKADVDALPICGLGESFDIRCSAPKLTAAGTQLLKTIKIEQEMLALIDRDIRKPGRTEEGIAEKDPTVYLFRRNLGTHLYLLGLEDSEIQYILGHEIESDEEERNHYRNEEKLYPIALKMRQRPVVNSIAESAVYEMDGSIASFSNETQRKIHIPASNDGQEIQLIVRQREPYSTMNVSFSGNARVSPISYTIAPNPVSYSRTLSILDVYHVKYRKSESRRKTMLTRKQSQSD